jgi:hypothetical protein
MEDPQVELGSQLQSLAAGKYPPVTGCCWRETHRLLFLAILLASNNRYFVVCLVFFFFFNRTRTTENNGDDKFTLDQMAPSAPILLLVAVVLSIGLFHTLISITFKEGRGIFKSTSNRDPTAQLNIT